MVKQKTPLLLIEILWYRNMTCKASNCKMTKKGDTINEVFEKRQLKFKIDMMRSGF